MINQEIRNRIKLSVAAYAYEFKGDSIMTDHEYDELSRKINPSEEITYMIDVSSYASGAYFLQYLESEKIILSEPFIRL